MCRRHPQPYGRRDAQARLAQSIVASRLPPTSHAGAGIGREALAGREGIEARLREPLPEDGARPPASSPAA
jgi:hypothetical protein